MTSSERQRAHYEAIHSLYEQHYYDVTSMAYRERFIYGPLFKHADLNGNQVADLACGSGFNSIAIKQYYSDVATVGMDISDSACKAYRNIVGGSAHQIDLTRSTSFPDNFDAAIVVGGLHHCIADLPQTLSNIAKLVRPGGNLLMMEPSKKFAINNLRSFWYKKDRFFDDETEEALDHDEILEMANGYFEPVFIRYFGGPAYFILLNSLILRVPLSLKPWLAPPLNFAEQVMSYIPWQRLYPCFLAVWRRTSKSLETDIAGD